MHSTFNRPVAETGTTGVVHDRPDPRVLTSTMRWWEVAILKKVESIPNPGMLSLDRIPSISKNLSHQHHPKQNASKTCLFFKPTKRIVPQNSSARGHGIPIIFGLPNRRCYGSLGLDRWIESFGFFQWEMKPDGPVVVLSVALNTASQSKSYKQ